MKIKNKILAAVVIATLTVPFPLDALLKNNEKNLNEGINKSSCNVLSRAIYNYSLSSAAFGRVVEPIVLNLNGNGDYVTGYQDGIYFDFNNDGFAEKMAWASNGYGILAADLNNNGIIDNGNEIVTDETLASFDSNNDGIINKEDKDYGILKVMRNDGSISSLDSENIAYIDTKTTKDNFTDEYGNYRFGFGTFYNTNGVGSRYEEYYLVANPQDTIELNKQPVTREIKALPDISSHGTIHSLHQAMLSDKTLQELVGKFVKETNKEKRAELVSQIILRWTNSENVDVSKQYIAVVDSLLGLRNPMANEEIQAEGAKDILKEQLYLGFENNVYAELMRQSHYKNLISKIQYKDYQYDLSGLVKYVDKHVNINTEEGRSEIVEIAKVLKGLGLDRNSNFFDPKNDDCFYTKFIANNRDLKWQVDTVAKIALNTKTPDIKSLDYDEERGLGLTGLGTDDYYNVALNKVTKKYDFVHSMEGDDVIFGDNGKNVIYTCHGNDMIDGGNGNDLLYGVYDNDIIFGRDGNDKIFGGSGNDVLIGGAGNDEIYSNQFDQHGSMIEFNELLGRNISGGNNTINGGRGNDVIYSTMGNDTFIFSLGDGSDVIYKEGGLGTLYFGKGIKWSDVAFSKVNNDMLISIKNSNDSIVVKDWFNTEKNHDITDNSKISSFEFADGTKHSDNEIQI